MVQEDKSKALTVRIPNDLWKSVKIKCVQEETNIQKVLADFLSDWVKVNVRPRR
jgi:predicted DNA binding CopG/RHH family protein